MNRLKDKIAWVTGAGSGIGRAAAIALAREGARLVLSGRRDPPLRETAARIEVDGGTAVVEPGDLTDAAAAARVAATIRKRFGRLDILVNNAGVNISRRSLAQLDVSGVDQVLNGNLSSAFYCVLAALPIMRAQKDGVLIHTASMAGRAIGPLSGAAYAAAKHGVVGMSHSINCEECVNGIRSTVLCPGEVATPILDQRPVPVNAQDRARMLQPEDVADLIVYVASLSAHVCVNEVWITPTWNRGYAAALKQTHVRPQT
jgi:NAD(P)-dependent dehydrogenase (short-subunit alcohol dehydrogenase family)